jgi:hypothetical protein
MEQKKDEFSLEKYLKELNETGPYPAGITPGGMLWRLCREFYEGTFENLFEKTKKYASSPLARRIRSAFL